MGLRVLELLPIHRGGLVAQARIQMNSGMILRVIINRTKRDPNILMPFPLSPKNSAGSYVTVVEFASDDIRKAWQSAVMEALGPHLADLANHSQPNFEGTGF